MSDKISLNEERPAVAKDAAAGAADGVSREEAGAAREASPVTPEAGAGAMNALFDSILAQAGTMDESAPAAACEGTKKEDEKKEPGEKEGEAAPEGTAGSGPAASSGDGQPAEAAGAKAPEPSASEEPAAQGSAPAPAQPASPAVAPDAAPAAQAAAAAPAAASDGAGTPPANPPKGATLPAEGGGSGGNGDEEEDGEGGKMSLMDHLRELRRRLVYCFIAAAVGFAVCMTFVEPIFDVLTKPLLAVLPAGSSAMYTTLPEAFFTRMFIAFVVGLFLVSPFIFYQIWAFISPGLYDEEKHFIVPVAVVSAVFFIGGGFFCYYIVFHYAFQFFVSFATEQIVAMPKISDYLDFVLKLLIAFGLVFEMPIFSFFLSRMGVVTAAGMRRVRRYAVLVVFIVAAIMTPPDVISQLLMAVPMLLLYEVSILVAVVCGKKRKVEKAKDEGNDEPPSGNGPDGSSGPSGTSGPAPAGGAGGAAASAATGTSAPQDGGTQEASGEGSEEEPVADELAMVDDRPADERAWASAAEDAPQDAVQPAGDAPSGETQSVSGEPEAEARKAPAQVGGYQPPHFADGPDYYEIDSSLPDDPAWDEPVRGEGTTAEGEASTAASEEPPQDGTPAAAGDTPQGETQAAGEGEADSGKAPGQVQGYQLPHFADGPDHYEIDASLPDDPAWDEPATAEAAPAEGQAETAAADAALGEGPGVTEGAVAEDGPSAAGSQTRIAERPAGAGGEHGRRSQHAQDRQG